MLIAYHARDGHLAPLARDAALESALWIDLLTPTPAEVEAVRALGVDVPSLADMEEIEISNRLYREGGLAYMTAVLPGTAGDRRRVLMPVSFILGADRLVTVRHHGLRPFETYPGRAGNATPGLESPERVFLGLLEEIVARLADLLEEVGRSLDTIIVPVLESGHGGDGGFLREALRRTAIASEATGGLRLGLLGVGRVLAFHATTPDGQPRPRPLRQICEVLERDAQALEVHADFLGNRASLTLDATMGMINVHQNDTVRMLSVVVAMFVPPTLIASIYGMNFAWIPGLQMTWAWALALLAMAGSSLGTFLLLRWKRWI